METNPSEQDRAPTPGPVLAYIARFEGGSDVRASRGRHVEKMLVRACAAGTVEVLDGALLAWPDGESRWRPLENLPRLAALPEWVWSVIAGRWGSVHVIPGGQLLAVAESLPRDGEAVVVFCPAPMPELIDAWDELGATVISAAVAADRYAEMRRATLPRSEFGHAASPDLTGALDTATPRTPTRGLPGGGLW